MNGLSGRPRVFTWHVHGTYLYYLCQAACDFYVPVKPGKPEGYGGRAGTLPWPENLHEVPAEAVRRLEFDCVIFQSLGGEVHVLAYVEDRSTTRLIGRIREAAAAT